MSVMLAAASVMMLVVSEILAVGVRVAVQVRPPLAVETALRVPFSTVRSELVKLVTASLKVNVTSEVSPAISEVSATAIVAVGRTVSIA